MKRAGSIMVLICVVLAGCSSDSTALRDYLDEVMRSNETFAGLVGEQRQWRGEHEPLLGTTEFSWDGAHAQIERIVAAIETEVQRLANVDAPEAAADLRKHTLDSYETTAEVFRRQIEVFELIERISSMREEPQADPAAIQALAERYEEIQQDLEVLAQLTSEQVALSTAERVRLAETL